MSVPTEAEMRAEFHRQHSGRNLKQHPMSGTYYSPPIAALWNQHKRTAIWMVQRQQEKEEEMSNIPEPIAQYQPGTVIAHLVKPPPGMAPETALKLRALIEVWPSMITGLNNSFSVKYPDDHPGNEYRRSIVRGIRPCITYRERANREIEKFYEALVHEVEYNRLFDVLFYELSADLKEVKAAWKCYDMKIESFDSVPSERNIGNKRPEPLCSATFSCKVDRSQKVYDEAREHLEHLHVLDGNPYSRSEHTTQLEEHLNKEE